MDARIKSGHDGCVLWREVKERSHRHQPQNCQTAKTNPTRLCDPAARCARVVDESLAPWRAWGMPDAQCTRGLVCTCSGRTHTSNNEYTGITRHSRTQWF